MFNIYQYCILNFNNEFCLIMKLIILFSEKCPFGPRLKPDTVCLVQ